MTISTTPITCSACLTKHDTPSRTTVVEGLVVICLWSLDCYEIDQYPFSLTHVRSGTRVGSDTDPRKLMLDAARLTSIDWTASGDDIKAQVKALSADDRAEVIDAMSNLGNRVEVPPVFKAQAMSA